jgi:hypothetical protein
VAPHPPVARAAGCAPCDARVAAAGDARFARAVSRNAHGAPLYSAVKELVNQRRADRCWRLCSMPPCSNWKRPKGRRGRRGAVSSSLSWEALLGLDASDSEAQRCHALLSSCRRTCSSSSRRSTPPSQPSGPSRRAEADACLPRAVRVGRSTGTGGTAVWHGTPYKSKSVVCRRYMPKKTRIEYGRARHLRMPHRLP